MVDFQLHREIFYGPFSATLYHIACTVKAHLTFKNDQIENLEKTKKALSFNGHVPTNVDLYLKYSYSWGAFIRIDWHAGHRSMCGWRSILPTIHAPSGGYNTAGTSGMFSGNNWWANGGLNPWDANWGEPYDGFVTEHIRPPGYATDTPQDYRRMVLTYQRSDRSRQRVHIHVLRSSIINPEWNTDFKLTLAGQPGVVSMRMTRNLYANTLKDKLIETWPLLGHTNLNIKVTRIGECNGGYAFEVRAQEHGKMPKLSITSTIRNRASRKAKVYIKDKYDTGVLTAVLPGSVLATGHHLPQVVVTANGQRSSCRDNCDFEWSAGFTPILRSVQASSNVIKINDQITFTFETGKYEGNLDNALFFISGVKVEDCGEVAVSGVTKSITCLVGRVPVTDTHTFEMIIPELGNANFEPPQKFSTILKVDETKPSRGSRNGGTRVYVTGSGFAVDDVLTVLMGGAMVPCDPIKETVDYTTVTCITRASNQIAPGRSPTLKEISQSKFNIMGGEEFTISGTFLKPDRDCTTNGEVFIGPNKAEVISWTDTLITAKSLPGKASSNSPVYAYVCNKGFTNSLPASTPLVIENVSANQGTFISLYGGKELTISGDGFGENPSLVRVNLENNSENVAIPCGVRSVSPSEIKCIAGSYPKTNRLSLIVTSKGIFYRDGTSARDITIYTQQEIEWSWIISLSGVVPKVQFQQTRSQHAKEGPWMWSEVISGTEGRFRKFFTSGGTFHYSTGLIDSLQLAVTGTIRIHNRAQDKPPVRVNVRVNNVEADHEGNSANQHPAKSDCVWIKDSSAVAKPEATGHYVVYSPAATPVVTKLQMNPSVSKQSPFGKITIASQSAACDDTKVTMGEYECSSLDSNGACDLNGFGLDVSQSHSASVTIPSMGRAYFDPSVKQVYDAAEDIYTFDGNVFSFVATIDSICPPAISTLGGSDLMIKGAGFEDPIVSAGDAACDVTFWNYTHVECSLGELNGSSGGIATNLVVHNETTSFQIATSNESTPTITSQSMATVSTTNQVIVFQGHALDDCIVTIGGIICDIESNTATMIECVIPSLPAGTYNTALQSRLGHGKVSVPDLVFETDIKMISPSTSGLNGGQLVTISGFGFVEATNITVTDANGDNLCDFDSNNCEIVSLSPDEIIFTSPQANFAGDVTILVSAAHLDNALVTSFEYEDLSSKLTGSDSINGALDGGESISLNGEFDCEGVTLLFLLAREKLEMASMAANIEPSSCSETSITFNAPFLEAGSYLLVVNTNAGIAAGNVAVQYELTITTITPSKIGLGGGVPITLTGSGFSQDTRASLCGDNLEFQGQKDNEIVFITQPIESLENCDEFEIILTSIDQSDGSEISSSQSESRSRRAAGGGIDIDESITPKILSVNPKMGSTAGGTSLTITGSSFGTDRDDISVTIHGEECQIKSLSSTQVVCETAPFPREKSQIAVEPIIFVDGGAGKATNVNGETFWYIDRWSSPYTWGCNDDSCKPKAGEIIVIPKDQVILLDESTPHLAVLIIDGGHMIWDRQDGLELHMDYGVVNSGGSFSIGTEEEPFCSGNALIKLYGHQRSINLPIYGAKVFAVRFGTFDVHGCPITTTWTELDETAEVGDEEIVLTHPVIDDWKPGNEIIIAATGDITNFHRSEKRTIVAVSADGYRVKIDKPIEYRHISVCNNGPDNNGLGFGWAGEICMRAEVGLLTRNIKLTGNKNEEFEEDLPECELGIGGQGELSDGPQTCFQNRFGHETGSDQFGSVLFLHKPDHAKIEFMEVTQAGQAFNLARYPIHFHTPGSLPTSYVRGCAIHNTFNRALTLHGVHDITVEYNVIYNVMGLAFFLEDAVEENNVLRYNLGIMNKKSSSLLNVDSTPSGRFSLKPEINKKFDSFKFHAFVVKNR